MAQISTLNFEGLGAILQNLGVGTPLPCSAGETSPLYNPINVYRLYLVGILSEILGLEKIVIYNAIQRTIVITKGDLALVIPRLGLRAKNPNELAVEIESKVVIQSRR